MQGGALERACGLDLGADDVISFPFETVEFAAKIRTQFRKRRPREEFAAMLKHAVLQKQLADVAVESLRGLLTKRRFWLIPAIFVLSTAVAFVALYLSSHGTCKETCQLRADIARLTSGLGLQSELLRRAEFARRASEAPSPSASRTRDSLRAQSADLGKRVVAGGRQLLDHGASAYVLSYEVYFPGIVEGLRAKLDRISSHADVATLQLESPIPPNSAVLELDDRNEGAVTGDPVVLIGYPTGIEGILARAGTDVIQKIAGAHDVTYIMSQIASQHLIRPTTTQGHIGDVLEDQIVYDAATTSGGSGGPPFSQNGKVIGINFAVLRDFGGSNLAVPVKYARELLK